MCSRKAQGLVLLSLMLGLAAGPARASSTAEILGAPTSANSLGARTLSRGSGATYFNPALLPDSTPKLEAGFFTLLTGTRIRLRARPNGVDVPRSVYQADLPPDSSGNITRPIATADLPSPRGDTDETDTTTFAVLGLVRPLLGQHLVFGFWGLLPVHSLLETNGFFPDEREQFFSNHLHLERYGDRLKLSSFSVALGSKLNSWLSVGAGLDIGLSTRTTMTVYMPNAADQSIVLLSPQINSQTGFAPYFATIARFWDQRLLTSLTVHFSQWGTTNGENRIHLWNYTYPPGQTAIVQRYTFVQGWEPLRVGLGAVLNGAPRQDGTAPWQVGLQTIFERWSQYHDRNDATPLDRWSDTFSFIASGAVMMGDRRLAADLAWYPSPVPPQSGRSNYVDCSRVSAALAWEAPFELFGHAVEGGIYLRADLLLKRNETKDPSRIVDEIPDTARDLVTQQPLDEWKGLQTNNPGYPGYSATGYMLGAGVGLRMGR